MVSTLCQFTSVCSSPTYNHRIVATVSGECSFLAHGETWHRPHIKSHRANQSWTSPTNHNGSTRKVNGLGLLSMGKTKLVVLLGGLHIEMAVLAVMGDWLEGSGWTSVIAAANVTTDIPAVSGVNTSAIRRITWLPRLAWANDPKASSVSLLGYSAPVGGSLSSVSEVTAISYLPTLCGNPIGKIIP